MSSDEIERIIRSAVNNVPYAVGSTTTWVAR